MSEEEADRHPSFSILDASGETRIMPWCVCVSSERSESAADIRLPPSRVLQEVVNVYVSSWVRLNC